MTIGLNRTQGTAATGVCVPSPEKSVRHEGAGNQWMRVPPEQWTVQLGSHPGGERSDPAVEAPGTMAASGGLAKPRAVTRVNPEQASKVQSRTPTRLIFGEGCHARGRSRQAHPSQSAGVVGMARGEGYLGNVGGPRRARGRGPRRHHGWRPVRASERPIVLAKPGNAGGGKGPHFGVLLKESRTRRLA